MKTIYIKYKKTIKECFVDDLDFDLVNQYHWNYSHGYAYGYKLPFVKGKRLIFMHRLLLDLEFNNPIEVDHEDHNGLNNQRYNLRRSTHQQNCQNTNPKKHGKSKYLGVSLMIPRKMTKGGIKFYPPMFQAKIKIMGKSKHLGLYKNEEDAARKYDEWAIKLYGEFANLNFKISKNEKDIAA